jgi:hypothetical protein
MPKVPVDASMALPVGEREGLQCKMVCESIGTLMDARACDAFTVCSKHLANRLFAHRPAVLPARFLVAVPLDVIEVGFVCIVLCF